MGTKFYVTAKSGAREVARTFGEMRSRILPDHPGSPGPPDALRYEEEDRPGEQCWFAYTPTKFYVAEGWVADEVARAAEKVVGGTADDWGDDATMVLGRLPREDSPGFECWTVALVPRRRVELLGRSFDSRIGPPLSAFFNEGPLYW